MSNGKIVLDDSAVEFLQEEVGGGSTVVANPTLVGDEDDLTGLEVDGTKYKVPQGGQGGGGGGSQLYQHTITLITGTQATKKSYVSLTIINSSASQFTINDVVTYFKDNGFSMDTGEFPNAYYPAIGVLNLNNSYTIYGIYAYISVEYGEEYLDVIHLDGSDNFTPEDIIDTVIAL